MSAILDEAYAQVYPERHADCLRNQMLAMNSLGPARRVFAQFKSHVSGIPCLIEVTHYLHMKGGGCRWTADSPEDVHGFTEADFMVLDTRGRRATWLEHRLSAADRARIESEIVRHMEAE